MLIARERGNCVHVSDNAFSFFPRPSPRQTKEKAKRTSQGETPRNNIPASYLLKFLQRDSVKEPSNASGLSLCLSIPSVIIDGQSHYSPGMHVIFAIAIFKKMWLADHEVPVLLARYKSSKVSTAKNGTFLSIYRKVKCRQ